MQRLTLCVALVSLFLFSNAQFVRPRPNLNIPSINFGNLGDFREKFFDILRKQEEGVKIPQVRAPVQAPVEQPKPKDNSPSPQCLSQTYQALNTLYSFGADSTAQDIPQLQSDYSSLGSLVQKINNFCNPRVEIDTREPSPIQGECSDNLDKIAYIMNTFNSGDPTNYLNVIYTVQSLAAIQANFTRDCSGSKQVKKESAKDVENKRNCENLFVKANEQVSKISDDAMTNDVNHLLDDYELLRETLNEVNVICEERYRINVIPPNRIVFGTCDEHFEELRRYVKYDRVSNLDETASNVKRVWDMLHKFLQSCPRSE